LAYISIDGMIEATTIAKPNLCRACFDGEYPMDLPDPELLGKQLLEPELAAGTAAPAAVDAIRRPYALPYDTKALTSMSETFPAGGGASYAAAGVDIEAGDRAVVLMKEWVKKTQRPEVLGGLGGFAGLFDASALKQIGRAHV